MVLYQTGGKAPSFIYHYECNHQKTFKISEEDINLNSRLFLWPSELEKVLDLSGARLSVVRENLETALRERRANFEQYLMAEKKKMDAFRLRDVREVLSLEELKEKVNTVDGLMQTLEVRLLSFTIIFIQKYGFLEL
jgi:hypothetical protein